MTNEEFKSKHGDEAWELLVRPRTVAPVPLIQRGLANDNVCDYLVTPMLYLLGYTQGEGLRAVIKDLQELREYRSKRQLDDTGS